MKRKESATWFQKLSTSRWIFVPSYFPIQVMKSLDWFFIISHKFPIVSLFVLGGGHGEVNISTAASCHPQAVPSPSHLHLWNGLRLSYGPRHRRQALLLDFATMLKHLKPPEENGPQAGWSDKWCHLHMPHATQKMQPQKFHCDISIYIYTWIPTKSLKRCCLNKHGRSWFQFLASSVKRCQKQSTIMTWSTIQCAQTLVTSQLWRISPLKTGHINLLSLLWR